MPSGCEFSGFDLIYFSLKLFCNSLLWIVTGISIYLIYTNVKFQKRVTNIILTNILISDSLSALLSALYREYLSNCKIKPYTECTVVIFFSRTFGYISMAFLIFFTVERYFKLTKPAYEYSVLMSTKRVRFAIAGIWIGFIIFSVATTPYWTRLTIPNYRNSSVPVCVFSLSMEPLTCFITLFISQFLSVILLVIINLFLVVRLGTIFKESERKLEATREQAEINKKIIKSVELDVFFMSLVLTALNLTTLGFTVTDLIKVCNILGLSEIRIPIFAFEIFEFFVTLYPCGEAMICFFMNNDIINLIIERHNRSRRFTTITH